MICAIRLDNGTAGTFSIEGLSLCEGDKVHIYFPLGDVERVGEVLIAGGVFDTTGVEVIEGRYDPSAGRVVVTSR